MSLSKENRELVRMKFYGKCAYCGELLHKKWHVDHFEPVQRTNKYVQGVGLVKTGEMEHPQRDCLENMMPACPPCNIDKHVMNLEDWRIKLQRACDVLRKNNPTYRHASRFGLLKETGLKIVFYFEAKKESGI